MRRTVLVLVALAVAWGQAPDAKEKAKRKEKSFEPAAVTDVRQLVGRYQGVDSESWLDLRVGTDGAVQLSQLEAGRSVEIRDVQLTGAHLEAVTVDANGEGHPFEGTFGNRVLNGVRQFGLMVEADYRIDDTVTLSRIFYRRI